MELVTGSNTEVGIGRAHDEGAPSTRCLKRRRVLGSLAKGLGVVSVAAGSCTLLAASTASSQDLWGPSLCGTVWQYLHVEHGNGRAASNNHGTSGHLRRVQGRSLLDDGDDTALSLAQLGIEARLQAAVGEWSTCTPDCTHTRQVMCTTLDFKIVPNHLCGDELPAVSEHCETDACSAAAEENAAAVENTRDEVDAHDSAASSKKEADKKSDSKTPDNGTGENREDDGRNIAKEGARSAPTVGISGEKSHEPATIDKGNTSKPDGKSHGKSHTTKDSTPSGSGSTAQGGTHDEDDAGAAERSAASKSATDPYMGLIHTPSHPTSRSDGHDEKSGQTSPAGTPAVYSGHGGSDVERDENAGSKEGESVSRDVGGAGRQDRGDANLSVDASQKGSAPAKENTRGDKEARGEESQREIDVGEGDGSARRNKEGQSPRFEAHPQDQQQRIDRIGGGPGSQRRRSWTVLTIGGAAVGSFLAVVFFAFSMYRKEQHRLRGILALNEFPVDSYINPFCAVELTEEDRSAFKL